MDTRKTRTEYLWFVPLWLASAIVMLAPTPVTVLVVPIAAMIATTPYRRGRMTMRAGTLTGAVGLFAAAALGLLVKAIARG